MTWQLAAVMNAIIALGYFAICGTILRGLIMTRQLRTNPLAIATAAIFFTCAVHHGAHTVHMLLPSFGVDLEHGVALRQAFGWQMVVWDVIGAAVAVYYLSLRRSYGTLLRTPAMFEDEVRRRTNERVEHERAMLTQAEELAGAGSWERDLRTGELTWSQGMRRIRGRTPDAVSHDLDHALADVHPDDRARVARELDPDRPGPDDLRSAYRIVRPDGSVRHLDTRARVQRDREGAAVRVVGTSVDVSERREIEVAREQAESDLREREQMLSEAEERFRGAFENAPIGMALIGLRGRLLQVNGELCEITGYDRVELEQLDIEALSHHEDARATSEALVRMTLRQQERHSVEHRLVRADRSTVWVQLLITLLRDRDDQPVRFIAQVQDISARRKFEQQLRDMANHDPLTGLLNRRSFERALEQQLAHARRYKTGGALLFIDLDDFKYVNDSLGHAAGDKLITLVAGALTDELRETDVLARLGGDEFAVLLPHTDAVSASLVADKLLRRVAELEVSMNGHGSARLTASSGSAMLDEQQFTTADDALVAADLAMYDAKETGKNRSLSYRTDEHYEPQIRARMTWIDRIKVALADDGAGFVLHAQPILDIQRGEVVRHELLVRMLADDGELIMPAMFLYIAERFDLIQELDRLVITRAAHALGNGSPQAISWSRSTSPESRWRIPSCRASSSGPCATPAPIHDACASRSPRPPPSRTSRSRGPSASTWARSAASLPSTTSAPASAASTTSSTSPSTT
ncbi:MAG: diguanylate cyclase [Solirubrobacterales bacterium]|nr:diguanylate cyclase [Solirubrobacterales bacterium]